MTSPSSGVPAGYARGHAATDGIHSTESIRTANARSATLEQQIATDPSRFRVLTGERPTGALHLGHLIATLANRVRLQAQGVETFLVVADYQVITDRDVAGDLPTIVREVLLDYIAAGIVPEAATIFTHSAVPALNQLLLPFLSLVTVAELERNPTVKAETAAAEQRGRRGMSGLMFTYPVHQAADILFCHGNLVPVGQDQLPHLEISRTIARRFNSRYSAGQAYFQRSPTCSPSVRTSPGRRRRCWPKRSARPEQDGSRRSSPRRWSKGYVRCGTAAPRPPLKDRPSCARSSRAATPARTRSRTTRSRTSAASCA